jgi:hypothetical protein
MTQKLTNLNLDINNALTPTIALRSKIVVILIERVRTRKDLAFLAVDYNTHFVGRVFLSGKCRKKLGNVFELKSRKSNKWIILFI